MSTIPILLLCPLLALLQPARTPEAPRDRPADPATAALANWPRAAAGGFVVYDELHARGRPRDFDLRPIRLRGAADLRSRRDPTPANVAAGVRQATVTTEPLVIDIETLPTDPRRADDRAVGQAHDELANLIDLAREAEPAARIGFYMLMPQRDYWTPVRMARRDAELAKARWDHYLHDGGRGTAYRLERAEENRAEARAKHDAWEAANRRFTFRRDPATGRTDPRGLADLVDVVYPSLYPFYDDPKGNGIYAEANLREARRYGKPVIAFVRPIYHESNKAIGHEPVAPADALPMYRAVRELADGVVIWDGRRMPFGRTHAEHAALWQILRDEPDLTDAQILGRVRRHPWVLAAPPDPEPGR